jgi:hypothetical protein
VINNPGKPQRHLASDQASHDPGKVGGFPKVLKFAQVSRSVNGGEGIRMANKQRPMKDRDLPALTIVARFSISFGDGED